jgi:hypothetical protein
MRSWRLLTILLAVVACAWPGGTAAAVRLAVEVHEGSSLDRGFLERVRSAGVDALAVDPSRVGLARLAEVRRAARAASLDLLGPRAVWASSAGDAIRLAAVEARPPVAARFSSPEAILRVDVSSLRRPLLALSPLKAGRDVDAWHELLDRTRHKQVTVVISPARGPHGRQALLRFLRNWRSAHRADVYVSPAGSDESSCTRRLPCRTLERAWRVARPSEIVELAAGTYPAASLAAIDKGSRARVLFRAAAGTEPFVDGRLAVYGSHLELRGFRARSWYVRAPASDLVLRSIDVGIFAIISASDVAVIGGDVGPHENGDPIVGQYGGPPPSRILFDGVRFHDFVKTDPDAHTECLQFTAGVDVTIRNSRFLRCSDHGILVKPDQGPIRRFLIENNWFARTLEGYYAVRLAPVTGRTCMDVLVRNNSALQEMYSDCEARDVRFVSNIQPVMRAYACRTRNGAVWDWNVYGSGIRCGANDLVAATGFRDAERFDLHLVPGAAAIGRGDPSSLPAFDIDGDSRPLGRPDAGADERP